MRPRDRQPSGRSRTCRFDGRVVLALGAFCLMAGLEAAQTNSDTHELRVSGQAVVQRGFMPDSSPRSIAVGLPGGLSYCFDAEACRLRYAWSGGFLDMKPTWHGRGAAPPGLLGTKFFTAPETAPLRVDGVPAAPKVKFDGYALVGGLPEFRFSVGGVGVKQRIDVAPGGGLRCILELANGLRELAFHAPGGLRVRAAGRDLPGDADGWVKIPPGSPRRFEVWIPGPPPGKAVKTPAAAQHER